MRVTGSITMRCGMTFCSPGRSRFAGWNLAKPQAAGQQFTQISGPRRPTAEAYRSRLLRGLCESGAPAADSPAETRQLARSRVPAEPAAAMGAQCQARWVAQ